VQLWLIGRAFNHTHIVEPGDDSPQLIVTDSIFVHARDDVVNLLRRSVRNGLQMSEEFVGHLYTPMALGSSARAAGETDAG
jgi:hypothetical protein